MSRSRGSSLCATTQRPTDESVCVTESTTTATQLFDELNRRGVRYCHFKSNSHLVAGLEGVTDLDLLFDGQQVELIEEILARHGFKRFPAHPSRRYPGVEDFFGVNEDTGRLLHLQVHYRMIVGERFYKNYRLPWEQEILASRTLDEPTGVFVANPALEWLLLVCRAALKVRWRDRVGARLGSRRGEAYGMLQEHRWLSHRAEIAAPVEIAERLLGARVATLVERALAEDLASHRLTALRGALLASPAVYRGHRPSVALGRRLSREARWFIGGVNRRYVHSAFAYSRSSPSGGTVLALIGSDGSGKSSVTSTLHSWLAGKVDVLPVYFGSGAGRSSILRWPLKQALSVVRRRPSPSQIDSPARRERELSLSRVIWALTLAHEKRSKLRRVERARERGFVVVCDRYPQTDVAGVSDGPLLGRWKESPSRPRRALARWEEGVYELAAVIAPDLVIRLQVTPDTAKARRPEDNPAELTFRTQLVDGLAFETSRYGVVDVDANRDLESVVLDVKRRLWPVI